jgi:hypothetical protein
LRQHERSSGQARTIIDGWFGTCHALNIKDECLAADSIESAQNEFLIILTKQVKQWVVKLEVALHQQLHQQLLGG